MNTVIPVILSGGSGTRLWPLSRKHYPKQFHALTGSQHTLLQETALRVKHLAPPIVVCNEDHRFMLAEQLHSIHVKPATILLEPQAKNTAPAIALAALHAIGINPDAVIAVFPADHVISNQQAFNKALQVAVAAAHDGEYLVTFGIIPSHAETGYGYIQVPHRDGPCLPVTSFVEKPDVTTAEHYLKSGHYLWNSGMFVFKATAYLAALKKAQPAIVEYCELALKAARNDLDFVRVNADIFAACPSDSIDYAVMEKANNVRVVPLDAGWSDIGGWRAIWEILDKDANNTASIGDVININTHNTLVHNDNKNKLVVTIGLDDLIVVDTKNALLVAHKDQVQLVKQAVEEMANCEREEHLFHREVHRPWGSYDSIDNGTRYQVKRITVKPGASLSLQMHHHRAEHWVVVSGTAVVQVGTKETLLTENQSVYIPIGETHRLRNPGKVRLELIEVQSGSYLGEDDIVRFEDTFGRV
ncbi:MAG: mannose-1-phosphate guanylyltransferase/mannose-6-phosphate isomerase [Pseudohongiella sp.]|nr:mannose-1-phosphate guanylyltransferase/mannose-6-phosphate isomerase [Pseudohongiella sp.]